MLDLDATGAPRPFVNAKGKRRRPGTKTLAGVLRCNDELFVDFIAKCLTWDPDKRIKPQAALRHAWIVSGRRRPPIVPAGGSSRSISRNNSDSTAHTKESSAGGGVGSKGLLISPPTPLMARQVPSSAPRAGQAAGSRLPVTGQSRNNVYTVCCAHHLAISSLIFKQHGTIKASLG
jgi:dual specificity tyrosine-phosphorylation-regulated kinase 2/3/4